jgi:hypothetical protein
MKLEKLHLLSQPQRTYQDNLLPEIYESCLYIRLARAFDYS